MFHIIEESINNLENYKDQETNSTVKLQIFELCFSTTSWNSSSMNQTSRNIIILRRAVVCNLMTYGRHNLR